MANKLIVCIMGQNCERFIDMCLDSLIPEDGNIEDVEIVYCDGGSTDETLKRVERFWYGTYVKNEKRIKIINNPYNQEDLGMNGKQRNFYLNYLKQNYPNDWALCLDADEVVEDLSKIKEFIQTAEPGIYSVRMRHLIGDLAHEDNTVDIHPVLNRLFKISEADSYPEVEHPVLQGNVKNQIVMSTIWHLAYIPNMWEIKKRYDNHLKKSNIHTPQYLKQWYHSHLFGTYPRKEFKPEELPKIILDKFGVNKDELYFSNRGVDFKHPLMVKQWFDYFKPENVLDLGCGRGPYLYFWNWFVDDIQGIELSEYAAKNGFIPNKIEIGDITEEGLFRHDVEDYQWDLITAIDVLEHLDNEQLDKAMNNIVKYGKRFLFSIPFDRDVETGEEPDPNLYNDKTHKQFRSRTEWVKLIKSYGIDIIETPKNWYFSNQLLIGVKQ